jgi:hypothetical protein
MAAYRARVIKHENCDGKREGVSTVTYFPSIAMKAKVALPKQKDTGGPGSLPEHRGV